MSERNEPVVLCIWLEQAEELSRGVGKLEKISEKALVTNVGVSLFVVVVNSYMLLLCWCHFTNHWR